MLGLSALLALIIFYQIQNLSLVSSSNFNALNGKHIRIIWPLWEGNPKGLTGPTTSGIIIDYLKNRFNFTYEMVRVTENRLDPRGKERGLFNYLWEGVEFVLFKFRFSEKHKKCDFLTAAVIPTFERNKVIDLTLPWMHDCYDLVYAVHDDQANIEAVIKPFQWPVWLGLLISIVVVITILNLLQDFLENRSPPEIEEPNQENRVQRQESRPRSVKKKGGSQYLYVFGSLLSQGSSCSTERLPFRLIAGIWTLAAFIFVQAYTSTLITYVVAPFNPPLINSINEIFERNDINLFYRADTSLNLYVMDPNATGTFLKLRKYVESHPNSRCNYTSQCLTYLTPGSRNVFTNPRPYILDSVIANFEATGKCGYQLVGDHFLCGVVDFALQKNSPYTDTINKGILDLLQTGLLPRKDTGRRSMPPQCLPNIGKVNQKAETTSKTSLSLKNLTGAFVVLLFGFSLSFLAFLFELITSMAGRKAVKISL